MRIGNSNLKSDGKKKDRSTNNRANKVSGLSQSKPKAKWEEDRNERSKAIHIQPKGINQNLFLESMRKKYYNSWNRFGRDREDLSSVSVCLLGITFRQYT